MSPASAFPPAAARRAMRLSLVEGACFAVTIGFAEGYFVADAVRLGAEAWLLGLLVGLPLAVGGAGAVVGLALLQWVRRRRPIVVAAAAVQAVLLLALAAAERAAVTTPAMLVAMVAVHHACGQASGTLWSSWYGDVVAAEGRGSWFARRARVVHLVAFLSLVAGGLLLFGGEPVARPALAGGGGGGGFALLFGIAGALRLVSAALLALSPEPPLAKPRLSKALVLLRSRGDSRPLRLLGVSALLMFAVYLGSPYFTPCMLDELRLDYRAFMAASAVQVAAKVLVLPLLGRIIDAHGGAAAFRLAALLVALIPIPWLFLDTLGAVLAVQAFSGVAWAFHEVALITLVLENTAQRARTVVFAAQSLLHGAAQLLGSGAAAVILTLSNGSFRTVFAASLAARLAVAAIVPWLVMDLSGKPAIGRGRLLLRIVGFRPSGGVTHRPVSEDGQDA